MIGCTVKPRKMRYKARAAPRRLFIRHRVKVWRSWFFVHFICELMAHVSCWRQWSASISDYIIRQLHNFYRPAHQCTIPPSPLLCLDAFWQLFNSSSVVQWSERRTRDWKIASSTPGRCIAGKPRSTQPSMIHPSGVGKSSTSLLAGVKAGRVHTVWSHMVGDAP